MLFDQKRDNNFGPLEERLRRARAITPKLVSGVIAQTCERYPAQGARASAGLSRLIDCGAWTDVALALVARERPQWTLRRLVYDDGEWLCSLSKQPHLPLGLDELAEARHEILPLAILIALVQARAAVTVPGATTVPQVRPASGFAVCCDDFA